MRPLIVLLVLSLTFTSLQGKSQKNGGDDSKGKKEGDASKGGEDDEKDDFVGVRFSNKTNKATFGFNNATNTLQIYNSTMKSKKLELKIVILEELDEDDKNVGESDEAEAYHDIQTVEVEDWVVMEPEDCAIEEGMSNITATCITANGTVNLVNNTNVAFKAALIGEDGVISLGGEETPVKAGNVRVSVFVQNWLWCCKDNATECEVCPATSKDEGKKNKGGDDEDQELQIGSYLHVGLSLVTPGKKLKQTGQFVFSRRRINIVGSRRYGAGDGASLLLSNQVGIDEEWMRMRKEFPKIKNKDSKTMISFACDKFKSSCRYDLIFAASSASGFEAPLVFVFLVTIVTFWH